MECTEKLRVGLKTFVSLQRRCTTMRNIDELVDAFTETHLGHLKNVRAIRRFGVSPPVLRALRGQEAPPDLGFGFGTTAVE